MSYLVLARKYRPKNFAEMVGQGHVVQALGNALSTQRLHHAYLFTGTRGVGKTTVSRILAKSLNCVGPDGTGGITAAPCGVCSACTDIDTGRFVDYTELDAASNRGVDEVQALLEQAIYKPVEGRFKVFMIDEVHMLTGHAFNAMLKTLEEPPEYLKFVLATTDPQKVPVTVLSRCLQFNLRPMAPETVFEHLTHVLSAEAIAAEATALRLLARAARGSMRDALSLTDQAIAFGGGALREDTVRQMLGAVGRGPVLALIAALAAGDGASVVATVDGLRRQGMAALSTLEEMTDVLQRMAVAQLAQVEPDPADPDSPEISRLAQLLPADQTQLLYSLCLQGRTELGLAPDEYAALVMILLRLLAFQPPGWGGEKKNTAPHSVTKQKTALATALTVENKAQHAPVFEKSSPACSAPPQPPAQPSPLPTPPASDLGAVWCEVVQQMMDAERIQAVVRELALQSQLVHQDRHSIPEIWQLQIENPMLNQAQIKEPLQHALLEQGWAVRLEVSVGPAVDTPSKRIQHARTAKVQAAELSIKQDPFVQHMMRAFGGTIVPGSVQAHPPTPS